MSDEWAFFSETFRNQYLTLLHPSPPLHLVMLSATILSLPQSTFYHFLHLSNPSLFLNSPTSPTFQYFPTFPHTSPLSMSSLFPTLTHFILTPPPRPYNCFAHVLSFPYPTPLCETTHSFSNLNPLPFLCILISCI